MMYHYTECGLPNVRLQNGYREVKTAYGEGVAIDNVAGLHRTLGRAIAKKAGRLTGAEFRFLRIELNLSQKALGRMFGKSDQSIACWEKGKPEVPQLEDAVIRSLYLGSLNEDGKMADILSQMVELDNQIYELEEQLLLCENESGWSACIDRAA